MTIAKKMSLATIAGVLLCFVTSCGESQKRVYPVNGQLFVRKQPAANALVIFTPLQNAESDKWPKGYPRGAVREDGSFQVTTYRTDDGAPAGEYAVTIVWLGRLKDQQEEYDKLQGRYADPANSKIRFHVKEIAAGNVLDPIYLD